MKISYAQNEFRNTELGKLDASIRGLVQVTLAADDGSYNITIKSDLPDNLTVTKKTILTVVVSKEIAQTVEERLKEINSEFVENWVRHYDSGALNMGVPEAFQEIFFSVLSSLPNGLTESQITEVKSRLEFNPSQVQRYSFWIRSEGEKVREERQKLMQTYNRSESDFDAGTQTLLKDILTQPVTEATNTLFRKALIGTYSDFHSHLDDPKLDLVSHLKQAKVNDELIEKAQAGKYRNDLAPWPGLSVSTFVEAISQSI